MDILLHKLFTETERWTAAIEKGVLKDINKAELYRLTGQEIRGAMYLAIKNGLYVVNPPRTAKIPKDNGEFRTVFINDDRDRVLLALINDLLFEMMPELIHENCRSYRKGIGCDSVVLQCSSIIAAARGQNIGFKADLSKFFDTVPPEQIEKVFAMIETKYGPSAILTLLRDFYADTRYYDKGELKEKYQSLKQGCSVSSFLADAVLNEVDNRMSSLGGFYVRYSDDILYIGKNYEQAYIILEQMLATVGLKLNPAKVEILNANRRFKFLGYTIMGGSISLSPTAIKRFQKDIENMTIKRHKTSLLKSIHEVNRYLYVGDGLHSWGTRVLKVINLRKDIITLNAFVLDCLRAVITGKTDLGGLGYDALSPDRCIVRGKGKNVKSNRQKAGERIPGYYSISCMQNALRTGRAVYDSLVLNLEA